MRKKVFGRKLSRNLKSRRALKKSLIKALIEHGSIITTEAKAEFIERELEKIISLAKKKEVGRRRLVYSKLGNNQEMTDKIFYNIIKVFSDTRGGYTRVIKLPKRKGDSAKMARIEWSKKVEEIDRKVKGKKKKIEKNDIKEKKAIEKVESQIKKVRKN